MKLTPQKPIDFFSSLIDHGKQIYAILDAAKNPEVLQKLWWLNAEYVSLYKGEPEEKLKDIAPYLVNLCKKNNKNIELIDWIFEECWGKGCAIFINSKADLTTLLKHFQKFLLVVDESGKGMFFRFCDPWVLQTYIPTCTLEELKYIYGPVSFFFSENEDASDVLGFPKNKFLKHDEQDNIPANKEGSVLIIRDEQMIVFKHNELEKFIVNSVSFLRKNNPKWSLNKSDENLRLFIKEMIDFGEKYNVHKEINIQKLMLYKINYKFDIPISKYLKDRLATKDIDETYRVEQFYFALSKNRNLIKISLG